MVSDAGENCQANGRHEADGRGGQRQPQHDPAPQEHDRHLKTVTIIVTIVVVRQLSKPAVERFSACELHSCGWFLAKRDKSVERPSSLMLPKLVLLSFSRNYRHEISCETNLQQINNISDKPENLFTQFLTFIPLY